MTTSEDISLETIARRLFCVKKRVPGVVDRKEALRYLGHTGQELTPELQQRFDTLAQRCETTCTPSYTWRTFPIDQEQTVWFDNSEGNSPCIHLVDTPLVLSGTSISRLLKGATLVTLGACTLGAASERELATLSATNALDAMLYGACCNALIESTAEALQTDVAHQAETQGLFARMRFSPGYGDLPLDVQPDFLQACDATRFIGLTCSASLLLIPTKSITAVIGLFDEMPPSHRTSPCGTCIARTYCSYLQKGLTCYGN